MPGILQLNDLRTYFRVDDTIVKAVDGVTYEVQEGETLAIVGESGCGKSVSALSIMGLIASPPGWIESGEVIFEGRDLLHLSEEEIRLVRGGQIAMVFQEPMTSLNPVLSIERQVTEAVRLHLGMTVTASPAQGRRTPRKGRDSGSGRTTGPVSALFQRRHASTPYDRHGDKL